MAEITLENIREKLTGLKAKTTVRAYYSRLEQMYNEFRGKTKDTIRTVFEDDKKVIDWVVSGGGGKFKSVSAKRGYLSAYLFLLINYDFDIKKRRKVQAIIKEQMIEDKLAQNDKIKNTHFDLKEAKQMFKKIDDLYEHHYSMMFAFDRDEVYDIHRMWAAYLYFVLNYGVLRNSEFASIIIADGVSNADNYINRKTGLLTIRDHKTKKTQPLKEIQLDKHFMEIIKPAHNAIFFSGGANGKSGGNLFGSGDGFQKRIQRELGLDNYEVRKAKTSIELSKPNNAKGVARLAEIQGHSVDTQLSFYNTYKDGDKN